VGRANEKYSTDRKQGDDGSQHEQANRVSHVLSIAEDASCRFGRESESIPLLKKPLYLEAPPNAILSARPP
jgi:hypothetical protein